MSRSLPGCVLIKDESKWKDRKMSEVWKMSRVAETHKNGRNVQCRVWYMVLLFANTCCPSPPTTGLAT